MINLSEARKWDEESDEVEEEPQEEEESPSGGWHPDGLNGAAGQIAESSQATPDWREQAFHGNSPAKTFSSSHRAASVEQPEFAEAAASPSVAVATVESKPAERPAPFSGDAWAAAMAAGVEEKIAEMKDVAPAVTGAESAQEIHEPVAPPVSDMDAVVEDAAVDTVPAVETTHSELPSEPANWAAAPETAWEVEAKKAALLASTWDTPKPFAADETQDVPAYSTEAAVRHVEVPVETAVESSNDSPEPVVNSHPEEAAETAASEPVVEHAPEGADVPAESLAGQAPFSQELSATVPAAPPAEPDIDELVARVLGKMSPDVLQKVTREILKPVIEAIVRDEINSKKS
jgi:hypothetical protein